MMLINTNTIITDDDLINFLLERYEETRNTMFLTAANSISLYRKDVNFLNFCTTQSNAWISVEDRLPEDFKTVLALCKDGGMFVGRRTSWNRWEIFTAMKSTRIVTRTVTHWMPLPAPPAEKEN